MDRPDQQEISQAANLLLHPGEGGIAVWVRRDELRPRAAIRFRGKDVSLEEAVTLATMLSGAVMHACEAMAKEMGIPGDEFLDMVEKASEVLDPLTKCDFETRR